MVREMCGCNKYSGRVTVVNDYKSQTMTKRNGGKKKSKKVKFDLWLEQKFEETFTPSQELKHSKLQSHS